MTKKMLLVMAMAVALAMSTMAGAVADEGTTTDYTITVTQANGSEIFAHEVWLTNDCEGNWWSESDAEGGTGLIPEYLGDGEVNDGTYTGRYRVGGETLILTVELEDDGTLGGASTNNNNVDLETVTGEWTSDTQPCGSMTQDDCKDGGFADFGYRNQGQCVSDVVTP